MTGKELSELIFQLRCNCVSREDMIRDECSLSPVEFRALTSMGGHDRLSATEFAEKLDLSPSRVSRVIERMVKSGLIDVETNSADRRGVYISLSKSGISQKDQVEKGREHCNGKIEETFSLEDREEIGNALKKFLGAMSF